MENHLVSLAVLILLLPSPLQRQCRAVDLHPIVLVHGYASTQLEARLTEAYKTSLPHCDAKKGKGWFRLFLNSTAFEDPNYVSCFAEQMSEVYDPITDDYSNIPGVETRVPFFGSTWGFRYTDPDHKKQTVYMATLVERLEDIGYKEGKNLFGAPYDFRYAFAPPRHPFKVISQYLDWSTKLIEKASMLNQNKPVIIISHSYGCLIAYHLLIGSPLAWRQKYIKHFIPVAAPWGGSVNGMFSLSAGTDLTLSFIDPLALKQSYRTQQSSLWLLPTPLVFGDAPLVVTKYKNYSACNMVDFFNAIGFSAGVKPYEERVLPLFEVLPPPQLPVTYIIGHGIETPERYLYGNRNFDMTPDVAYGDGDGVINLVSLLAIESNWSHTPGQYFKIVKIANTNHTELILADTALKQLIAEVYAANSLSL